MMDLTELIAWAEAEAVIERRHAANWKGAGAIGVSHVAHHTVRAQRFEAVAAKLRADAFEEAQR